MMKYREIKESIINNVLGPQQTDKFRVIGYQDHGRAAEEVLNNNRLVQVYYREGDFDKKGGRLTGSTQHDMSFSIEMTVSASAKGDIRALKDPNATPEILAAALDSFATATEIADNLMDELIEIIYQILMDARNYKLGMEKGIVANRWISNASKSDPVDRGEHVVLMAQMRLTCRAAEQVKGILPNDLQFIDTSIEINEDNNNNTGVSV